eukprot:CAMPEP_0113935148 /NCGR_PEP_ID=MMETSP1339-20121228/2364_1 /TAXON_ID=94617 /ORGANISM="Fibrocapsa japonica" /LENGTH=172 /DNA_ID=CAMNT_0000937201 /DNA_START=111 /DNA_END=630 /DNA_ORIENTATION=+ /assembly_acc=CAM_ASM_000762
MENSLIPNREGDRRLELQGRWESWIALSSTKYKQSVSSNLASIQAGVQAVILLASVLSSKCAVLTHEQGTTTLCGKRDLVNMAPPHVERAVPLGTAQRWRKEFTKKKVWRFVAKVERILEQHLDPDKLVGSFCWNMKTVQFDTLFVAKVVIVGFHVVFSCDARFPPLDGVVT